MSLERVRELEELAFRGWPALETIDEAGWRLRFAGSYTKRANSINSLRPDAPSDDATLDRLEAPYRQRGQRPVWRLTPLTPAAVGPALERRFYPVMEESLLQVCPLDGRFRADPEVRIHATPVPAWLAAFTEHSPVAPQHRESMLGMLAAITTPGFALVEEDGEPMAMALGAIEGVHMGLFDVLVMPKARRRGLARRVTESLYAWAMSKGARVAYLQVVATNVVARPLYEAQGFTTVYTYHYRAPPA
jgi:ribosomal protein S18 acetylase RimI-like enzyme